MSASRLLSRSSEMIGRHYWCGTQRVVVRARWGGRGPRNVLVECLDLDPIPAMGEIPASMWCPTGALFVRPFRGLRRAVATERSEEGNTDG